MSLSFKRVFSVNLKQNKPLALKMACGFLDKRMNYTCQAYSLLR